MASTYLTRTYGNATSRRKCTISFWIKKGFSGDTQQPYCSYADNNNRFQLYFESTDELSIYNKDNGSDTIYLKTKAKYRDPNAWYHIYASVDTTLSTAGDRVKIYVNGERVTEFNASQNIPNQNSDLSFGNNAFTFNLGRYGGTGHHVNGILSHFYFIDGSVVAHTEFGSTDSTTGEWKISTNPTISDFGNEGCKLFIDNNSVTDQSGKGNNMTVAAGTLTKTEDNPSNIFATWNPLNNYYSQSTFANGNTKVTMGSSQYTYNTSTLGMTSGKWYAEFKQGSGGSDSMYGISSTQATSTSAELGNYPNDYGYYQADGKIWSNNSYVVNPYGATWSAGDIIGVAVDLDNNKLYFSKNGTWQNSGDPTSGSTGTGAVSITAPASTSLGAYFFGFSDYWGAGSSSTEANFGNGYFGTTAVSSAGTNASNLGIFEYDVPTGYTALSTKGLNE
mgnify:CR=1 FL=1